MADGSVVDRLVVAVTYAYDRAADSQIRRSFADLSKAAAAAGAAMLAATVEAAHAGDQAAKTARALDLTAEAYTGLAFAADRSGVNQEQLSIGLVTLTRQMDAARAGTGPAADAFRKLGLQGRIIAGEFESAADLFPQLADALNDVSGKGSRAALELILLGESGPKMKTLLNEGSEGIRELTDRAEALGGVISDEAAAASEELVDSMTDLGTITTGLSRRLGFGLAPSLNRIVSGINDWYVANSEIIGQKIDGFADSVARGLDAMSTPLGRVATGVAALGAAWSLGGGVSAVGDMATKIPIIGPAVVKMGASLGRVARVGGPVALLALAFEDLYTAMEGGESVSGDVAEYFGVGSEFQTALTGAGELLGSLRDLALEVGEALVEDLGEALDKLADMLDIDLPDLDLGKYLEDFGRGARYAAAQIGAMTDRLDQRDRTETIFRPALSDVATGATATQEAPSASLTINATAAVTTGVSKQEAADVAAAEVRRQVLEGLDATGVSP